MLTQFFFFLSCLDAFRDKGPLKVVPSFPIKKSGIFYPCSKQTIKKRGNDNVDSKNVDYDNVD